MILLKPISCDKCSYVVPQDGNTKQDCENQAAKRYDLYSREPVCKEAIKLKYNFIFVCNI